MADSPTTRNRFRKQEVGAKTNAWGTDWNEDGGSDRLDEALDGVVAVSLASPTSLTSVNYESDQARKRALIITGAAGSTNPITIPAVEKNYLVYAGTSGDVTLTNGSNSVVVKAGNGMQIVTDGTNIYRLRCLDYGSDLLKSSSAPTVASHLANKNYVDSQIAIASLSGSLPALTPGFFYSNGTSVSWLPLDSTLISAALGYTPQPQDADLTALASVVSGANLIPRFTGVGTAGTVAFDTDATLAGNSDTALASQKAVKAYIDNVAAGLDVKPSVRVATTASITLSGAQTIDGVAVVAGDRVLVKNQGTVSANGLYACASGAWTRASDMDTWAEVPGANVWVEEGTANAGTAWVCVANTGGTIGSTAITWTQFGGAGAFQASLVSGTNIKTVNGNSLLGSGNLSALSNFAEAVNSSSPNATIPVVSLTASNAATNVDAAFKPKGTGSVLAQIPDNTATGGNKRGINSVDLQTNRATATQVASGAYAVLSGGQNCIASGDYSATVGGDSNQATGIDASALGGRNNIASGACSVTMGDGATASKKYQKAFGVGSGLQDCEYRLYGTTTTATPLAISTDGAAAGSANQIVLPNDSTFGFSIFITARRSDADNESALFKIEGAIDRNTNAASTALVAAITKTVVARDSAAWDATATADTTNGALTITVTGEAAKTIWWLAKVFTIEINK